MNTYPIARSRISICRWFQRLLSSLLAILTCSWSATAQNGGSISNKRPLAIISGEKIYEDDLPAPVVGQLREIRQHEYDLTMKALQELVREKLLAVEAKRKGVTAEMLLQDEVDQKIGNPSPREVEAFYLGQRDHSRAFEEVKAALSEELKRSKIQAARDNFVGSLQYGSDLAVLLPRPRVELSYDYTRLKGSPRAPVMIVEFSDFNCPFCRQAESTLKQLAEKYQGKVSFAYRDFPLRQTHPHAQLAAEAARCAGEQAKFWEYHNLLFANPTRDDRADLLQFAQNLGLDEKGFDSCLTSGKYKLRIEQDVQDGMRIGVSATPAFFINGVSLLGAQPISEFEKIIEEELQSTNRESAKK